MIYCEIKNGELNLDFGVLIKIGGRVDVVEIGYKTK